MNAALIGGVPAALALLPDLVVGAGAMVVLLLATFGREGDLAHARRINLAAMAVCLAGIAAASWLATSGPTIATGPRSCSSAPPGPCSSAPRAT